MRKWDFVILASLAFVVSFGIKPPAINPALAFASLWTIAIVAGYSALLRR